MFQLDTFQLDRGEQSSRQRKILKSEEALDHSYSHSSTGWQRFELTRVAAGRRGVYGAFPLKPRLHHFDKLVDKALQVMRRESHTETVGKRR